jgi:hypothetical protein
MGLRDSCPRTRGVPAATPCRGVPCGRAPARNRSAPAIRSRCLWRPAGAGWHATATRRHASPGGWSHGRAAGHRRHGRHGAGRAGAHHNTPRMGCNACPGRPGASRACVLPPQPPSQPAAPVREKVQVGDAPGGLGACSSPPAASRARRSAGAAARRHAPHGRPARRSPPHGRPRLWPRTGHVWWTTRTHAPAAHAAAARAWTGLRR